MSNISALDNIPQISFIDDLTLEALREDMVATYEDAYEAATGEAISLADDTPMRMAIYSVAAYLYQAFQYVDRSGKQDLIKYSYSGFLDNLAALKGVTRASATKAMVTLRFTLSAAQVSATPIPAGTRATTAASAVYFETVEYVEVAAGESYVDVTARCTVAGTAGNSYAAGALNVLVDPLPYVASVVNTIASSGGSDEESDEDLAERTYLAPSSYSTAGPADAYIYWVKQYNSEIGDVKVDANVEETVNRTLTVYDGHAFLGGNHLREDTLEVYAAGSITPATTDVDYTIAYEDNLLTIAITESGALDGESELDVTVTRGREGLVRIYVLMDNGSIPGQAILDALAEKFGEGNVRPMTDIVEIGGPNEVPYSISLTYYINRSDSAQAVAIQTAVSAAVETYTAWQRHIGRDINPSKLIALIMAAGAKRVVVTSPVQTAIAANDVAALSGSSVTYGGLEDD